MSEREACREGRRLRLLAEAWRSRHGLGEYLTPARMARLRKIDRLWEARDLDAMWGDKSW